MSNMFAVVVLKGDGSSMETTVCLVGKNNIENEELKKALEVKWNIN